MDLFGTAGIRGDVTETVTPELAATVGRAIARTADTGPVVVGHDGRTTSEGLAAAVTAGVTSGGADVRRIGYVPTPALAYASRGRIGVMVTASHNPPTDNGIKLFADGVEYDSEAEATIAATTKQAPPPVAWDRWGQTTDQAVLPAYREAVVRYVNGHVGDLKGTTAVVDCGTGMAGLATPQVLRTLGARPVALNANVDGTFPARDSKPTPESLERTRQFVATTAADIGIAHDGDADRTVVIGPDGELVHEDTVLAVLAHQYVDWTESVDPVVVTTPNASERVDERVEAAGGRVERTALGTLHEGIERVGDGGEETAVVFAGEPWKHVHPDFGGWIDGVVSAALITGLTAAAGDIGALTADVTERPYRKVSLSCADAAKTAAMERIKAELPEVFPEAEVATEYGLRLSFPDQSWVLVRPSGTEPYLRVYAESDDVDGLVGTVREEVRAIADAVGGR